MIPLANRKHQSLHHLLLMAFSHIFIIIDRILFNIYYNNPSNFNKFRYNNDLN